MWLLVKRRIGNLKSHILIFHSNATEHKRKTMAAAWIITNWVLFGKEVLPWDREVTLDGKTENQNIGDGNWYHCSTTSFLVFMESLMRKIPSCLMTVVSIMDVQPLVGHLGLSQLHIIVEIDIRGSPWIIYGSYLTTFFCIVERWGCYGSSYSLCLGCVGWFILRFKRPC